MESHLKSRSEIYNNLISIANKSGYDGNIVKFIIQLLANEHEDTINEAINILLEGNALTASSVNSLLTIASSKGYSAYRGTCDVYKVVIKPTITKLPRGTKLLDKSSIKLYVLEDYEFSTNEEKEIKLVASTKYIEEIINVSGFYYNILTPNLCNESNKDNQFKLFDSQNNEVQITNSITHKDSPISCITIQDYGVSLIFNSNTNNEYKLSTFEYTKDYQESLITEDNIKYKGIEVRKDSLELNYSGTLRETREEIKKNYLTSINSLGLIRSNTDILDSFKLKFNSKIVDCEILKSSNNLIFNYIPRNSEIDQFDFSEFRKDIKTYLLGDLNINLVKSHAINVEFNFNVIVTSNTTKVYDLLMKFKTYNVVINPYELIADINKIPEVDHVKSDWSIKIVGPASLIYNTTNTNSIDINHIFSTNSHYSAIDKTRILPYVEPIIQIRFND